MEREAKRKAAGAAAPDNEIRPSKRQKLPGDADPVVETVETTTNVGLKFVESLKAAKDKTGRPIATHFLTLPDPDELPEYYDDIKLPIAIDTIEGKLKRGEYANLAQVESDCKRLVNNAKKFNDKKSIIYEDAERIRKTASNFMVKHNPAYRDANYSAQATPIPGEDTNEVVKPIQRSAAAVQKPVAATHESTTDRPRRAAASSQPPTPAARQSRSGRHSTTSEQKEENPDFSGKSFQQAQEQIVQELIDYVDPESDLKIFQPFHHLPSRQLKDYYQLIRNPMSLDRVQKKVQGVQGRGPPTHITDLKSWNAFEEAVSLIWHNAREYNEDGSDIYNLSIEFEDYFKGRLEEAKSKVQEPPQPKLKINMSAAPKQQSLKIRLGGGNKASPAPSSDPNTPAGRSSATPGVIVDNEALERQRSHVKAGINGHRPQSSGTPSQGPNVRNPFGGSRANSGSIPPLSAGGHSGAASPPAVNGIKNDPQSVQSPALNSIRLSSQVPESQKENQRMSGPSQTPLLAGSVMPPPQSRTASGSPYPSGPYGQQQDQPPPPNYYVPPTAPQFASQMRPAGKNDPLIPSITLSSHPMLNLPHQWSTTIPASKEKTQQSITMTLPHSLNYVQIVPHVPVALTGRLYRLFVTVNNTRVLEVNRIPAGGSTNGASGLEGGKEKGKPLFEGKLIPGSVNRIEVECIAEKEIKKGDKKNGDVKDPKELVELEKCTIFVHVMRP